MLSRSRAHLITLYDSELRVLWGSRFARVFGTLVVFGYGSAIVLLARAGDTAQLDGMALQATRWLCWLCAGLVALSAARNRDKIEGNVELASLVRQRGGGLGGLAAVRRFAVCLRALRLMLPPTGLLGVLVLAFSGSTSVALSRGVLVILLCVFAAAAASVLGLLSDWACTLHPERAGWMLVALVVVPHLARSVWPITPSVPALFEWMLSTVQTVAARAS